MPKKSAGILLYRIKENIEIFLVHPGGPFWANKDAGAWSIPKGEFDEKEEALEAAKRELEEETGIKAEGSFLELSPVKQKTGKIIYTWAHEKDFDPKLVISNTCTIEWPPRSGKKLEIQEINKGAWFQKEEGFIKILPGQAPILAEFFNKLSKK